jgi:DNA-binding transcriptional LysR family regulator
MEIHQLEVFLTVARERSFSKAALHLYRTQPAISHAIRKLEDEIGAPLLERTTRVVQLTDAGQALVEYAERMLNLRDELPAVIRDLQDVRRGNVIIAANEFTVNYLLPPLGRFNRKYPHISVEVRRSFATEIPAQVRQHAVDIGIISFDPGAEDLETVTIATDPLVLVLHPAHRLAKTQSISIKDLGKEVFIAHNVPSTQRRLVIQAFERYRIPLNRKFELPTIEAIKKFVQMEMGVALLPRVTVESEVVKGLLKAVRVKEIKIERRLRLLYRKNGRLTHAARAFLAVARNP